MNIKESQVQGTIGYKYEAIDNNIIIGRATLYILTNELHARPFGLLEDVYVEENSRSGGIGTILTEHVIKQAQLKDCYKLICTSRYSKPKVHKLYERVGFNDHGKEFRIDFYRDRKTE